jgi:hypothetical protein
MEYKERHSVTPIHQPLVSGLMHEKCHHHPSQHKCWKREKIIHVASHGNVILKNKFSCIGQDI